MRAGLHSTHVTGVNRSGDALVKVMMPVTSSSKNCLVMGLWWSAGLHRPPYHIQGYPELEFNVQSDRQIFLWCGAPWVPPGAGQCLVSRALMPWIVLPFPWPNSKLASIRHCINIVLLCIDASSAFKYCYRQGAHYSVSERWSLQTPSAYSSEVCPDIVGRAYRHTGTIHTTVLGFSVGSCNKIAVNQPAF